MITQDAANSSDRFAAQAETASGDDGVAIEGAESPSAESPSAESPSALQAAADRVREPERFTGHRVRLEIFDGPLDLLLYLIRANRYDVCEVSLRAITAQFVEFVALMQEVEADYAGDFLVTAATLMQIKARALLPRAESVSEAEANDPEGGQDPRAELVERLLEYQRIQEAAGVLAQKRDQRADLFARSSEALRLEARQNALEAAESGALPLAEVSSFDLLAALRRVLQRLEARPVALVAREPFSLPERLRGVQVRLYHSGGLSFEALCDDCQSRLEVVVTFLAILELIRRGRARARQLCLFDDIWIEIPPRAPAPS